MKLHATLIGERGKEVSKTANEFLTVEYSVNRVPVGEIELYLYDDEESYEADDNEWLLKYRATPEIVKDAYGKEYCQECGKYNALS